MERNQYCNFSWILLACLITCLAAINLQGQTRLMPFTLKDQFNKVHQIADYQEAVVILVMSDRDGKRYNQLWSEAIYDSMDMGRTEKIKFLAVADVRGVPKFFRGIVRRMLPRDRNVPVLLDWQGAFAKHYKQVPGKSNMLIFDRQGNLRHRFNLTKMDQPKFAEVIDLLKSLVNEARPVTDSTSTATDTLRQP